MAVAGNTIDMLLAAGQTAQAEGLCRAHLAEHPSDVGMVQKLGLVLLTQGRGAEAVPFFDRAAESNPPAADFWANYATLLPEAARKKDADAAYRRALELDPAHYGALVGLSALLRDGSILAEGEVFARRAVESHPGRWEGVVNLSSILLASGKPDLAVDEVGRAIARMPAAEADLLPSLLNASNYSERLTREEVFEPHKRFGTLLGVTPAPLRTFLNTRDPERRLRVGLLSPDLRAHSVSFFVEGLLARRDPARLEIVCYSTGAVSDATTARLRGLADGWVDAHAMSDTALLRKIRSDKADILVELSGHTSGDRLRMLAKRAAPVQMTYCGYPNTTGVPAIDYRIVDSTTDPAGAEAFATERLLRLDPCMLCYTPPADAPEVGAFEAAPREGASAGVGPGGLRLGSFNALSKITPGALELWASLLRELPRATMFLKNGAFADAPTRERVIGEFESRGVTRNRLELVAWAPTAREGLALYSGVDVCLDSFPYTGTTTTCESLFMGVPVVTLAGSAHAGRVSASLLGAVGLGEFIAEDAAAYREIVLGLAGKPERLRELRSTLRSRLLASPLCDAGAFAARFEAALRGVWRAFCAVDGTTRS